MEGPVCLIVLDGFGLGEGGPDDAIAAASTVFLDRARSLYPSARLETSGEAVGLPPGLMGNSEVGHMTLGAGRIIQQEISRIQESIESGAFAKLSGFEELLTAAARADGQLHLMGLISNGGVHSSLEHLDGILAAIERRGIRPILHAFTDGRDTPPQSALTWIAPLEERLRGMGGCIATLSGRYWAMDRDRRWERVARAYAAIALREGVGVASAVEAIEKAYGREQDDEFIEPSVIAGAPALSVGAVFLHLNFRADRARELTQALTRVCPDSLGPEILALPAPELGLFTTLTVTDEAFQLPALFERVKIHDTLGEIVSRMGKRQLRIAETEKYAHVTYFFNGGREKPLTNEDRILVPSPRDVRTYDQKPEMSAVELTDRLLTALDEESYGFVLLNFANPDMVGHTGKLPASVRAVEVVDACLDRVCQAVLARKGTLLITADHGNIEQMIDPRTGEPHTAHTTNAVPLLWIQEDPAGTSLRDGGLSDIAPTLCELLGTPAPEVMTGRSLLCFDPSSSS